MSIKLRLNPLACLKMYSVTDIATRYVIVEAIAAPTMPNQRISARYTGMLTTSCSHETIDNRPGRSNWPMMKLLATNMTANPKVPPRRITRGATDSENSAPYTNVISQGLTSPKGIAMLDINILAARITLAVRSADSCLGNPAIFPNDEAWMALSGSQSFSASEVDNE
jgi:hypothetical protein